MSLIQLQKIFSAIVILIISLPLIGQKVEIDSFHSSVKTEMSELVVRRIAYSTARRNLTVLENRGVDNLSSKINVLDVLKIISYPGFGMSPCRPKFIITRVDSLNFSHDFDLYELKLDLNACQFNRFNSRVNTDIGRNSGFLYNHYNSLKYRKKLLIARHKTNGNLLYISGFDVVDDLSMYFSFTIDNLEAYEDFLKLRLFSSNLLEIKFLEILEGRKLLFRGKKYIGNTLATERITINADTPNENIIRETESYEIKYIDSIPEKLRETSKVTLFRSFREKRQFILDALMRNIVSYGLMSELLDSGKSIKKIETVNVETTFPRYDEGYKCFDIKIMDIKAAINKGWNRKHIVEFRYDQVVLESDHLVGYKRRNPNIEFYQVFKGKDVKRTSLVDFDSTSPSEQLLKMCQGNPQIDRSQFDNYLVALDVTTKELYFISGKNVFLSNVLPLYDSFFSSTYNPSGLEGEKQFQGWSRKYQLDFIQDLLYSENVILPITEDHIVNESDIGLELNVPVMNQGRIIYKDIYLDYRDPLLLRVN